MVAERKDIMLAYTWDQNRFDRWPKPCILQPKINGDRCRAVIVDGRSTLYSSSAKEIVSMMHINNALDLLQLPNIELDGEIYLHGMHQQLISGMCRRQYMAEEHEQLEYWIFDIIDEQTPQMLRTNQLAMMDLFPCHNVEFHMVHNLSDVEKLYGRYKAQGFEGIILRHPGVKYVRKKTPLMMKLKPRLSDVAQIVGVLEEHSIDGEPKNALGAIRVKTTDNQTFKIGSGFTRKQREELWKYQNTLIGKVVKFRYQELSQELIPLMPSFECFIND